MFNHNYEFICPNCSGNSKVESETEIFDIICPCGAPSKMVSHTGPGDNILQNLPVTEYPAPIDTPAE